ncbi:MAG: hypothetical protein P4N59_11590 [Negativicutes bacterium]|nr:hypothetical protein [Negativicutes bacterium]
MKTQYTYWKTLVYKFGGIVRGDYAFFPNDGIKQDFIAEYQETAR